MTLTAKQSADYVKLKAYYPYRMFFLVKEPDEEEATIWALRDKRAVNEALRRGATVYQLEA